MTVDLSHRIGGGHDLAGERVAKALVLCPPFVWQSQFRNGFRSTRSKASSLGFVRGRLAEAKPDLRPTPQTAETAIACVDRSAAATATATRGRTATAARATTARFAAAIAAASALVQPAKQVALVATAATGIAALLQPQLDSQPRGATAARSSATATGGATTARFATAARFAAAIAAIAAFVQPAKQMALVATANRNRSTNCNRSSIRNHNWSNRS